MFTIVVSIIIIDMFIASTRRGSPLTPHAKVTLQPIRRYPTLDSMIIFSVRPLLGLGPVDSLTTPDTAAHLLDSTSWYAALLTRDVVITSVAETTPGKGAEQSGTFGPDSPGLTS